MPISQKKLAGILAVQETNVDSHQEDYSTHQFD